MELQIKEIAQKKGMNLKDVCEKCGYKSLPSFYRQINNPETINVKTLIRIADAIGCEVNDFFVKPVNTTAKIICPKCGEELCIDVHS